MELTKIKPRCPFSKPENECSDSYFTEFCNIKLGVAPHRVRKDLASWLDEDHGGGDPTIFAGFKDNPTVKFFVVAKENFILSGLPLMVQAFWETSNCKTKLYSDFEDGAAVKKGDVLLAGEGTASSILLAERVAMNFCSKMSGIATKTHSILSELRKHSQNVTLLETRKTTPGLRIYEKYSVRVAGARNHRHGLDTGSLLKENHLRSIGSIEEALENLRQNAPILTKVEIEVTNLTEFRAALKNNPDVIMLDNFLMDDVKVAIQERNISQSNTKLELSGNLDERNIKEIAQVGVDYLSMGALIHKAVWVDLSMQLFRD